MSDTRADAVPRRDKNRPCLLPHEPSSTREQRSMETDAPSAEESVQRLVEIDGLMDEIETRYGPEAVAFVFGTERSE